MVQEDEILDYVIKIVLQAGQIIMGYYNTGETSRTLKNDNSPLTKADIEANDYIVHALTSLTPNIPIVSEESLSGFTSSDTKGAKLLWMIDPLDGTREFIEHNDEFTVNVALISNGRPILGVVYAPALDLLYYATKSGAWKKSGNVDAVQITKAKNSQRNTPIFVASINHLNEDTKNWIKQHEPNNLKRVGSSLKFCQLADGSADVYPRLSPLHEWDIAAADIILKVAGGLIVQVDDGLQPTYNKPGFSQTPFIAFKNYKLASRYLHNLSASIKELNV